jgi:hypothetical protein
MTAPAGGGIPGPYLALVSVVLLAAVVLILRRYLSARRPRGPPLDGEAAPPAGGGHQKVRGRGFQHRFTGKIMTRIPPNY